MKLSTAIVSLGTCWVLVGAPSPAGAQDWMAAAPKGKALKLDNAQVRVIEATFAPGEAEPEHTHPAKIIYGLGSGTLKVTYKDGKSEDLEIIPGGVLYADPERPHTAVNTGKKPLRVLIVELKNLPYTEKK